MALHRFAELLHGGHGGRHRDFGAFDLAPVLLRTALKISEHAEHPKAKVLHAPIPTKRDDGVENSVARRRSGEGVDKRGIIVQRVALGEKECLVQAVERGAGDALLGAPLHQQLQDLRHRAGARRRFLRFVHFKLSPPRRRALCCARRLRVALRPLLRGERGERAIRFPSGDLCRPLLPRRLCAEQGIVRRVKGRDDERSLSRARLRLGRLLSALDCGTLRLGFERG